MSKFFIRALLIFTSVILLISPVAAQDSLRVTVANLSQDVNLLEQSLKTMRLEIEELRRENAIIRAKVGAASSKSDTSAQISSLSLAIETLRREYASADEQQEQQILAELNRQISVLARNPICHQLHRQRLQSASSHDTCIFLRRFPQNWQEIRRPLRRYT